VRRHHTVEVNDMYDLNEELKQENDFLAKKLDETEEYIRKVELQNGLLTSELNILRIESKNLRKSEVSAGKLEVYTNKRNQIEMLRQDLK
jgi:hypothetical protein